jgi:hypothetical protein
MVSEARRQELARKGYFIEDMGVEYGLEYEGQFRWMNSRTNEFQDYEASYSINDAWTAADLHDQEAA